ncbi:sensor histidine kinase [Dactylosporangium darangshiense]|uniref:sensor histidine kinase n=1 Tax=Dactylosporangium darangshiense TaxID=579108 RepID=UPI00363021A8
MPTMLNNLRITQRLTLLVALSLGVMVMASVPLVVDRVDGARAAAVVVRSASDARLVGAVIEDLQRERLLALGYVASERVSRDALVAQIQQTDDSRARARAELSSPYPPDLYALLSDPGPLHDMRQLVLRRTAAAEQVAQAYHAAVVALLDRLRLADQPGADLAGLRQTSALDTLLRLNEEVSQTDAALVMAAADPAAASELAVSAGLLAQVYHERFQQQGEPVHVAMLAAIEAGPSVQRVATVVVTLTRAGADAAAVPVEQGLPIAQGEAAARHSGQDSITRDIAVWASERTDQARAAAAAIIGVAVVLLIGVCWLGALVSRSVARPLRRVTLAATAVADLATRELRRVHDTDSDDGPPRLAAVMVRSADEIGELASAFNQVQATATLLMQQQVTTRRNVAVMYGNIANRTRSLVERQLARIDQLEREEADEERLAQLYQLDHLTSRLRRSAESLLVIAGRRDDGQLEAPAPLADIVRSAVAEIEGYQNVRLGRLPDVVIRAAAVPDLTLMLAELLENATSFSPPEALVDVSATLHSDCVLHIVDHGIGMPPGRLAEENQRLISPERLDIAPTTMLGLLVVGRLARRHAMTVRLLPPRPLVSPRRSSYRLLSPWAMPAFRRPPSGCCRALTRSPGRWYPENAPSQPAAGRAGRRRRSGRCCLPYRGQTSLGSTRRRGCPQRGRACPARCPLPRVQVALRPAPRMRRRKAEADYAAATLGRACGTRRHLVGSRMHRSSANRRRSALSWTPWFRAPLVPSPRRRRQCRCQTPVRRCGGRRLHRCPNQVPHGGRSDRSARPTPTTEVDFGGVVPASISQQRCASTPAPRTGSARW